METLEQLPSVARLSQRVLRVLGQNPGKFTLQGTNTYLLGSRPPFILIDTGEGKPEYIPHLRSALEDSLASSPSEPLVSDIIITHKHHDHHGGLPSVLSLLRELQSSSSPRIHKFPLEDSTVSSILSRVPAGTFTPPTLHELFDGQELRSPDVTLRVIHTPGHTQDSVCLHLIEENALFSADTVLGQGTAVFEDLGAYMRSLRAIQPIFGGRVYPGHGPVVEDGPAHVGMYIAHRQQREDEVVRFLESDGRRLRTVQEMVETIYAKYPQNLWPAAMYGLGLHLAKLKEDGRVTATEEDGVTRWSLL
ncbi:Metallo-hydrolase/oxidoreductase [Auricularia subglabra TFB-10046 SS5]|nr:Metallo-hydrolase/oxidoreductase [Auricularia subglabra TFB-10046 SS5]